MGIRLVCSDLDGTLLQYGKKELEGEILASVVCTVKSIVSRGNVAFRIQNSSSFLSTYSFFLYAYLLHI